MKCPSCSTKISIWDVAKEFSCSKCGARLRVDGKRRLTIFEILAFLGFGWVAAYLFARGSYVLCVLTFVVWVVAETLARNHLQTVERSN
jgi:hypothetical protein